MTASETTPPPQAAPPIAEIQLAISGMTCAACVARVEKKLNKLPGVQAVVNLATEQAQLTLTKAAANLSETEICQTVEKAGYHAKLLNHTTFNADGTASTAEKIAPAAVENFKRTTQQARLKQLRTKFWVAALLSVPIVILSMLPSTQFRGWQWVVAILSLPLIFWCARPFFTAALRAARHGSATMDTLVALGVLTASVWSYAALFFTDASLLGYTMEMTGIHQIAGQSSAAHTVSTAHASNAPHLYFESAAMIVTFLLLGRWLEVRSRRSAGSALQALLTLAAEHAYLVTNAQGERIEKRILAQDLAVGDIFRVNPGEKIPTDGIVTAGSSAIDLSFLTGESLPREVTTGDEVTGAAMNTTGSLLVRATRVGEDTQLAQMGRILAKAQTGKAPVQRLADKISAVFVPAVLLIALLTFAAWLIYSGSLEAALVCAITVLVVACPCALGLATPTALLVGSGRAARNGIFISRPDVLERAKKIDTILLDKTGTLTTGEMAVAQIHLLPGTSLTQNSALALAAALESYANHPIATAIVRAAEQNAAQHLQNQENHSTPAQLHHVHSASGYGVSGEITASCEALPTPAANPQNTPQTIPVAIGQAAWLENTFATDLSAAKEFLTAAELRGQTAVVLTLTQKPVAVITFQDQLRPEVAQFLTELRHLKISAEIVSGDAPQIAQALGTQLTIPAVGGVSPAGKLALLTERQNSGKKVAMLGDGVNDGPALAAADLSLAVGSGTDVAKETADITLLHGILAAPKAIAISRKTLKIIRENLFWAFGYNLLAIPLAAFGIIIPGIAAAAMSASSVIVVLNSLRLYRWQTPRKTTPKILKILRKYFLTFTIGAAALLFLVCSLDFTAVTAALSRGNPWFITAAALATCGTYFGATLTLKAYLPEPISFPKALVAQIAASVVTIIAPAGVGPAVVNFRFFHKSGISTAAAVASAALIQFAQLFTIFLLLALLALTANPFPDFHFPATPVFSVLTTPVFSVLTGFFCLIGLLIFCTNTRLRNWLRGWVGEKIHPTIGRFTWIFQHPARLLSGFLGICVNLGSLVCCFYLTLLAFGHAIPFFTLSFTFLLANALGSALPAPGGIGPVEAALTGGLMLAGVSAEIAFATAFTYRLLTFWGRAPLGWIALRFAEKRNWI